MRFFFKITLIGGLIFVLAGNVIAQKTPQNVHATYQTYPNEIALDWKVDLESSQYIEIESAYQKPENFKPLIVSRSVKTAYIDKREKLKAGEYFYRVRTAANNGKKSDWSNTAKGAIKAIADLETPKILKASNEFSDRIELVVKDVVLKQGQDFEVERAPVTKSLRPNYKPVKVNQKGTKILIDSNSDLGTIQYRYRIRIVEGDRHSEWSDPIIGQLKEK